MGRILFLLYQGLMTLSYPIGWLWIQGRLLKGSEDRSRLSERFGKTSQARPEGPLVWIHAASVGESLATLGLIDALCSADPSLSILLTTGTASSARVLARPLGNRPQVIHQMVPLDWPWTIRRFMDHWKPDVALFVESDFWPILLRAPQERGIPTLLVNAQISYESAQRWRYGRSLLRYIFQDLSAVFAVSEAQAARLKALGAPHVQVTGSLKWTAAPLADDEACRQVYETALEADPFWMAVSTHPGEEEEVIAAHQKIREAFPRARLILVPRAVDRVPRVQALLQKAGLTFICHSKGVDALQSSFPDVFLVDGMGKLGPWFHMNPIAFIGGSLVPRVGGHNLIEPGLLGAALLHGPRVQKQQDIVDLFQAHHASKQVADGAELAVQVQALLEDPSSCQDLRDRALTLVTAQKAKVLKILTEALLPLLHKKA